MSTLKVNAIRQTGASSDAVTLASDGTCTAKITNNLSNRNLIINGACNVAQRGTTFNSVSQSEVTLDRFRWEQGGTSVTSVFNITQTSNAARDIGFEHSLKAEVATVDSSLASDHYSQIKYLIETDDIVRQSSYGLSSAKKMTLSFYVKSSVTGTFPLALNDGSGSRSNPHVYTINSANTWERKTITFNGDTGGNWQTQTGNAAGFGIRFGLAVGSGYFGTADGAWAADSSYANLYASYSNSLVATSGATWELTGVQLEVSDHATEFEHLPYGVELARCQRYCVDFPINSQLGLGQVYSGSGYVQLPVALPVPMRTKPSVSKNGDYWFNSNIGNSGYSGDRSVTVETPAGSAHMYRLFVAGGSNQGNEATVWCQIHDAAGTYMRLEAEL